MTLIYKINDLERKIPYKQWEALKKEFIEFAKEKKQLETNRDEAIKLMKNKDLIIVDVSPNVPTLYKEKLISILERGKE